MKLTTREYDSLTRFLTIAKDRKDLTETANRYTDEALELILSALSKIDAAVREELAGENSG